jgi:phosphoglycerate dehydrogenase-like enzyme
MTKSDRDRAEARLNKASGNAKTTMVDRDATTKAVLDNMARLKALRLAREAAAPPQPTAAPKKARARVNKPGEKSPALAEWLASQQSGGRRT